MICTMILGEKFGLWVLFALLLAGYHAAGSTYEAAKGTVGGIMQTAGDISGLDKKEPADPYGTAKSELEDCKT